jgi:hypothetical protein
MAHYAFIDEQNIVTEVIVGNDETTGDWEAHYAAVRGQRCLRTSYNTQGGRRPDGSPGYRLHYAGIGYQWREDLQGFIPPCPGEGWTLDESTGTWVNNQETTSGNV